jgi:hypothetical protein
LVQDVLFGVCLAAEDKHRKPLLCHETTLNTLFCGIFYVCDFGNVGFGGKKKKVSSAVMLMRV